MDHLINGVDVECRHCQTPAFAGAPAAARKRKPGTTAIRTSAIA
jgi:hypothetical protein